MKNLKNNQKNSRKLAGEWFFKAEEDALSARDLLKDKQGAASTVCFLSQQMAEKYLKGFLVFQGEKFPKIHDLDRLVRQCTKIDATFEQIKDQARYLADFYVATRYPGDYPQFSFEDAKVALDKALEIKKLVLDRVQK